MGQGRGQRPGIFLAQMLGWLGGQFICEKSLLTRTLQVTCQDLSLALPSLNACFLLSKMMGVKQMTSQVSLPESLDACSKTNVLILGPDHAMGFVLPN